MILPTKRLPGNRSLLAVGGAILKLLNEPKTVSRLWDELGQERSQEQGGDLVTYDWFVLALDFLYLLNAIELDRGRITRMARTETSPAPDVLLEGVNDS